MEKTKGRLLWMDNAEEPSLARRDMSSELKPYVRFLEFQGYDVSYVNSGMDGIDLLQDETFHAIILNYEVLNGELLSQIRTVDAHIPIILLTKTGGQEMMSQVSMYEVDDVLIMPTSPRQIVSSLVLLLERKRLQETCISQAYVRNYHRQQALDVHAAHRFLNPTLEDDWQMWIDAYIQSVAWDMMFDGLSNVDELKTIHAREKREANANFARYVQNNYSSWLESENSPTLSMDIFYKYVIPEIQVGKSVLFVVMDCMRLDHWLKIEPILYPDFRITQHFYYAILPTTTHYCRNAIFSGLFPRDLSERYPELYAKPDNEHNSINRFEKELMLLQLDRHGIVLKPSPHYFKIFDVSGETQYLQWFAETKRMSLAAVVIGFLDMLTHLRSEVPLFQQLVPDEEAFRSIVQTWFQNSPIYKIMQLAAERGMTIIVTSDHGSVLCQNPAKISSRHGLTSGIRVKEGKNMVYTPGAGFLINEPERYRLPGDRLEKNYILALADNYFVYENQFHAHKERFQGSFQHGGISLEEMILPCVVLEPR